MLFAIADASSLDFDRFELTGNSEGVSLEYVLAADDWLSIVDRRQAGEATAVRVTLEAGEYSYTAVVPLNASARVLSLSHRPWPAGTEGELSLRQGTTGFDRVGVGERTARRLSLEVRGGVRGAQPTHQPLSVDPVDESPPPQPVDALPPPEPGRNIAEPTQVPTVAPQTVAPQTVPPQTVPPQTVPPQTVPPQTVPPQTVPPAQTVPPQTVPPAQTVAACQNRFRTPQDEERCIKVLSARAQPLQELSACTALARPRHQRSCVEAVANAPINFTPVILACTSGLGSSGDALGCVTAAARHGGDPLPDVQACIQHIPSASDVVGCVKRASRIPFPLHGLLQACAVGFPADPLACLARTTRRGAFDRTDLVSACTTAFEGADRHRCVDLLVAVRGEQVGGVVRACVSLYDRRDLKFSCIERAREDPDEQRIRTCGELKRRGSQLACIGD